MSPSDTHEKINACIMQLGLIPEKCFYENTAFFLGWKVSVENFTFVYRLENETLLICDLHANKPKAGLGNVLRPLMQVMNTLVSQVSEIKYTRAMIRQTGGEQENAVRQKMVDFLLKQGGRVFYDNDDRWIEICH